MGWINYLTVVFRPTFLSLLFNTRVSHLCRAIHSKWRERQLGNVQNVISILKRVAHGTLGSENGDVSTLKSNLDKPYLVGVLVTYSRQHERDNSYKSWCMSAAFKEGLNQVMLCIYGKWLYRQPFLVLSNPTLCIMIIIANSKK